MLAFGGERKVSSLLLLGPEGQTLELPIAISLWGYDPAQGLVLDWRLALRIAEAI
jgi:hypothetical protein